MYGEFSLMRGKRGATTSGMNADGSPFVGTLIVMPKLTANRSRIKDFLWRHSAGIAVSVMVCFVVFLALVGYSYIVLTRKFESSRRWDLPSRIYSDATPIVPGMTIPKTLLEEKLNHVGYHEVAARVTNPGEYR